MTVKHRILNLALLESTKSNIAIQKMGCVIYKGNQIVAKGYNQVYDRNSERPKGKASMHAEMTTIESLARKHKVVKDLRKLLVLTKERSAIFDHLISSCRKGR
jgi:deoxycytidylate deaminase